MSDFLTRMAERALGAGDATRPVLPRRFAPLPGLVGSDHAFWERALASRREAAKQAEAAEPGPPR